jgi:thiol-disulfide isomerase/thioredoxin
VLVVAVGAFVVARGGDSHDWPSARKVRATELTALVSGREDATVGDLLRGKPLVLNFFARWCQPCLKEMPAFESVHKELGDKVVFAGVSEDLDPHNGQAMVTRTGVSFPTYIDKAQSTLLFFKGVAMPTTVFIKADGTITAVDTGKLDAAKLRRKIDEHFGIGA